MAACSMHACAHACAPPASARASAASASMRASSTSASALARAACTRAGPSRHCQRACKLAAKLASTPTLSQRHNTNTGKVRAACARTAPPCPSTVSICAQVGGKARTHTHTLTTPLNVITG